jgi:hypothetical protein
MLVRLSNLTKLRHALQAAVAELAAEAERHPEAPVALAHLRVASQIEDIDRQIKWLSNRLLQRQSRRTG